MSLFEQAYSFLNCTYCGNFFGRNEMVFCCRNQWHHDCFDYETVYKMCIDDHVDSTHGMDKQDGTEIIDHRYDIMGE
ncbi:unnamed protein product, partial [Mesorhabditis belari]|uniref:Uncharacterized protein n=1 Tax=Mesorhabditis belari TaxID=2138241 RepID=A0AAF3FK38_9BILA